MSGILFKYVYNLNIFSYRRRLKYASELMAMCTDSAKQPTNIKILETSADVDTAITDLHHDTVIDFPIIGMDAEFLRRPEGHPEVKLLQFATKCGDCYLIRINKLTNTQKILPRSLTNLLSDGDVWKTGIAVYNDAVYLLEDFPQQFQINGTFDLRYLAYSFQIPERGLKKLANRLLGIDYGASRQLGGWDRPNLHADQIMYAAWDALVGVLLFEKFFRLYKDQVRLTNPLMSDRDLLSQFMQKWKWKTSKQFQDDYVSILFARCASFLKSIFNRWY